MPEISLLDEFLSESREHLAQVEKDFMALEKGGSATDPEVLNRIFRAMHTVKGSSGFFNLKSIGGLAHVMETVLDRMREHIVLPTPEVLDTLLSGVDRLNAMLADIGSSNAQNTAELEKKILQCLQQQKDSGHEVAKIKISMEQPWTVSEIDWEKIPKGHYLYRLDYDLNIVDTKHHLEPIALLEYLQKMGLVHDGYILVSQESDPVLYQLLFSTVLEPDLMSAASHPDAAKIVLIPIPEKQLATKPTEEKESVLIVSNPLEHKATESDSLKVKVDILDRLMQLAGELVLVRNQQLMLTEQDESMDRGITQRLDLVTSALQETIMRTRMQPIGNVFGRFTRVVRDLGRKLGKNIVLETEGNEVELDKNILDALVDPLTHIIRNSCDHGIEDPAARKELGKAAEGKINLRAYHEGGQIHVDISDDGNGISRAAIRQKVLEKGLKTKDALAGMSDAELVSLILLPGFSTASEVSEVSGRGVGMDVVKTSVESLGGIIEIESEEGRGTTMHLRLPLTLAIIPCMVVEVLGQRFAIPQIDLVELVCLYDDDVLERVECAGAREVFRLRDSLLTLIRLEEILNRNEIFDEDVRRQITEKWRNQRQAQVNEFKKSQQNGEASRCSLNFAVLKVGTSRFGLIIDRIIGTEEIVVKPMHRAVKDLGIYSGATVLGDGSVAMILDVLGISRHSAIRLEGEQKVDLKLDAKPGTTQSIGTRRKLLLFDNGRQEQLAVPMEKIKRIEHVQMDKVEHIGTREFLVVDQQSTRLLRLDQYLEIASSEERKEMYLLLPNKYRQPYGILISNVLDVGEFDCQLDHRSYRGAGVEGTLLIKDRMTLLLDPAALMGMAEPSELEEVYG